MHVVHTIILFAHTRHFQHVIIVLTNISSYGTMDCALAKSIYYYYYVIGDATLSIYLIVNRRTQWQCIYDPQYLAISGHNQHTSGANMSNVICTLLQSDGYIGSAKEVYIRVYWQYPTDENIIVHTVLVHWEQVMWCFNLNINIKYVPYVLGLGMVNTC